MVRYLLIFYGALSLVLGIIGIFLPFLPTTPFILLTATCWAQASPRFHNWLYHHRYFGPIIQNWENNGAVPRKAKFFRYRHDDLFLPVDVLAVSGTLVDWCHIVNLLQLHGCVDVAAAGSINKTGRHCCLPVFCLHT